MANLDFIDFDHAGQMAATAGGKEYQLNIGFDEFGLFWGEVVDQKAGKTVFTSNHYKEPSASWAESLGYLSTLGRIEL